LALTYNDGRVIFDPNINSSTNNRQEDNPQSNNKNKEKSRGKLEGDEKKVYHFSAKQL
jgi:hypothetical protein